MVEPFSRSLSPLCSQVVRARSLRAGLRIRRREKAACLYNACERGPKPPALSVGAHERMNVGQGNTPPFFPAPFVCPSPPRSLSLSHTQHIRLDARGGLHLLPDRSPSEPLPPRARCLSSACVSVVSPTPPVSYTLLHPGRLDQRRRWWCDGRPPQLPEIGPWGRRSPWRRRWRRRQRRRRQQHPRHRCVGICGHRSLLGRPASPGRRPAGSAGRA